MPSCPRGRLKASCWQGQKPGEPGWRPDWIASRGNLSCHSLDDIERLGEVVVGVGEGEASVSWGALPGVGVKVDAAIDAAGGEAAIELMVVAEGVRPRSHRLGNTEVDAETGP